MDDHDKRVAERAEQIWHEKGSPAGGPEACRDEAEELVAIEENFEATLKPVDPDAVGPYGEPVEPLEGVENEGEFPTLTDQGEEETVPHRRR